MRNTTTMEDWLLSEVGEPNGIPELQGGGQPPSPQDPGAAMPGGEGQQPPPQEDPNDINADPQAPEMPEEENSPADDFEIWKNNYHKNSIKGNVTILIDLINQVRDQDLNPVDRKFVEDNLQIQYLRAMSNIMDASKKIRKGINEDLDRNNPTTSLIKHIYQALQEQPLLSQKFIQMLGYYAMKGEINRKFMGALAGAVQVSSGSDKEDLIVWDNEYSIMLSTRMNARFGDINLGHWSLKKDDPHHFLSEPERTKLETGSPQERQALRHRVIMESIFNKFKTRGFLITVTGTDGTVYLIGWDLATSLKAAYLDGKLVVRTKASENSECMLDDKGNITSYLDVDILYSRQTGDTDAEGKPTSKEVRFLERRNGILFLEAPLDVIKEANTTLTGLVLVEIPFSGNPSDLIGMTRAVYNVAELLARQP